MKSFFFGARVAWVNREENPLKPELPSGVGVQFVDLAPEDLASIASCLEIEAIW
jgi:hypothetical protein